MSTFVEKNFFSGASNMRSELSDVLENPKEATERRFCWDYWHVPDQYTFLRTPAWEFFSEALYKKFEDELTAYGRKKFGCQNITPPWLSCYVEGCTQALHADVPHGPWAYVFSLTEWQTRVFTGGETQILKESTLDYWRNFDYLLVSDSMEEDLRRAQVIIESEKMKRCRSSLPGEFYPTGG